MTLHVWVAVLLQLLTVEAQTMVTDERSRLSTSSEVFPSLLSQAAPDTHQHLFLLYPQ